MNPETQEVIDISQEAVSDQDESLSGQEAPKEKSRAGRKLDPIWDHFTQGEYSAKAKKRAAECNYCGKKYSQGKVADLQLHILEACSKITPEVREAARSSVAAKRKAPARDHIAKKTKQSTLKDVLTPGNSRGLRKPIEQALLRFVACNGIPFNAFDSATWKAFVDIAMPGFQSPSARVLAGRLLIEEYALTRDVMKERLAEETNVTINFDGWSDTNMRSVLTGNAVTASQRVFMLGTIDCGEDSHTGVYLADKAATFIREVGPEKVAAVVTDSASAMVLARTMLKAQFPHIIILRCFMHAFALVMKSIVSHPWAAEVVSQAQRVVTFFRASSMCLAALNRARAEFKVEGGGLQTSNKTRFTSVLICLASVLRNKLALVYVLNHPDFNVKADVSAILSSSLFWVKLKLLCQVLEPISQVIMAVQRANATLADVTRYWMFLARTILLVISDAEYELVLTPEYLLHICTKFNQRSNEMDSPVCRLALMLDPRFKAVALPAQTSPELDAKSFRSIAQQAMQILKDRGFAEAECCRALSDLKRYKAEFAPYNSPCPPAGSVRDWWEARRSPDGSNDALICLALVLLDIVPHAAETERIFSIMGWIHSDIRNRMSVERSAMLTAIKLDATEREAKARKDRPIPRSSATTLPVRGTAAAAASTSTAANLSQACTATSAAATARTATLPSTLLASMPALRPSLAAAGAHTGTIAQATAYAELSDDMVDIADITFGVDEIEELLARLSRDDADPPLVDTSDMSLVELLTSPWDGFDIRSPVLDPAYVPPQRTAAQLGGLRGAGPGNFDIETLLRSQLG